MEKRNVPFWRTLLVLSLVILGDHGVQTLRSQISSDDIETEKQASEIFNENAPNPILNEKAPFVEFVMRPLLQAPSTAAVLPTPLFHAEIDDGVLSIMAGGFPIDLSVTSAEEMIAGLKGLVPDDAVDRFVDAFTDGVEQLISGADKFAAKAGKDWRGVEKLATKAGDVITDKAGDIYRDNFFFAPPDSLARSFAKDADTFFLKNYATTGDKVKYAMASVARYAMEHPGKTAAITAGAALAIGGIWKLRQRNRKHKKNVSRGIGPQKNVPSIAEQVQVEVDPKNVSSSHDVEIEFDPKDAYDMAEGEQVPLDEKDNLPQPAEEIALEMEESMPSIHNAASAREFWSGFKAMEHQSNQRYLLSQVLVATASSMRFLAGVDFHNFGDDIDASFKTNGMLDLGKLIAASPAEASAIYPHLAPISLASLYAMDEDKYSTLGATRFDSGELQVDIDAATWNSFDRLAAKLPMLVAFSQGVGAIVDNTKDQYVGHAAADVKAWFADDAASTASTYGDISLEDSSGDFDDADSPD